MAARTPVPVKLVVGPVRAIRGGGRGRPRPTPEPLPSAELVEIRQLRADLTTQRPVQSAPEPPPVDVTVVDEDHLRPWLWRYRHVLRVFYVAFILAASKLLILAPSFLPLLGLATAVGLGIAAAAWARKTSTATVLTKGQRESLADLDEGARRWAERLASPRAGAIAAIVCAAGWWLRPDDLLPASVALAASAGVVAGVRGWRFRIRPALVEPAAAELPFGPREAWIAHVALGDKFLERATVTGPADVLNPKGDRIGFSLTVDLPQGSPAAVKFSAAVKDGTATTFRVGADMDVIIGLYARDAARFDVTILDVPGSSALDHVHRYERSTFDVETGTFRLGYRADWSPALIQIYDPKHGARHGHLSGETGGGKSATLEQILQNATSSGVIVPLIVDIAQTLTDWADRTPVYVTTREDAVQLLRNMEALHDHRMAKMRGMREIVDGRDAGVRKVYPVDAAHPMYLAVFDEWAHHVSEHKVDAVSKALLTATERVVTQTRKTMQGMLLVGQATGLVLGFGNNQNIRTQCQAGYMIAHRNNNESGRQVFGNGLAVDPSKIPMGLYGAGFAASVVDQRDAMTRTEWVEHPGLVAHEIDIRPIPPDELAVLMRGLSVPGGLPLEPAAPAEKPTPAALLEPAVTVGRPNLTVVPTSASDGLKRAMKAWAREQARPVRRGEFIDEFAKSRLMASRYKVDKALAEMKDDGDMDADADGYYTLKEAA